MNIQKRDTQRAGMAGEYHVMSALYRKGYAPNLTLGAAKGIDIVVDVGGAVYQDRR